MTRRSTDPGPEEEKGSYVRHGIMSGIAMVVRNALRVGMPVWERGGDVAQLGGEFVLGPGFECSFAHRMTNTRNHTPITDVLAAAGVRVMTESPEHSSHSDLYPTEDGGWTEPHSRKRGGRPRRRTAEEEYCMDDICEMPYGADHEIVPGCWGSSSSKSDAGHRRHERDHDSYKGPPQPRAGKDREYPEKTRTTPRRGFIVHNPDHDEPPPLPTEEHLPPPDEEERGWESDGAVSLRYVDEFGRIGQGHYEMTQDVGAYEFGRA